MNEAMKRLIEVLNGAGYKVLALENMDGGINDDGVYTLSGIIELKIFDASINQLKL